MEPTHSAEDGTHEERTSEGGTCYKLVGVQAVMEDTSPR